MAAPWYCTREDVKRALDVKETARSNAQVDRAIDSASRTVEGRLHRRFYPETATRTFDWPNAQRARPWRLWLDQHELASVTTLMAGGVTVASSDFLLYPTGGPPYNRLEIDLDSSAAFASGDTHQQAISIAGVYAGCPLDEAPAGALAEALDASETSVDVTDAAAVGVGDILRVGTERMIVTGRAMLDTGQNIAADLTASNASVTVTVTDGTAYAVDEVLLVGSERMLVVDVAGNDLTVRRAWDGSVLAAHTAGADVYAPRTLTVTRGALGTTAAAHDTAAAVVRHLVPGLVRDAVVALALAQLLGEQGGYTAAGARSAASGSVAGSRPQSRQVGGGAGDVLAMAFDAYGRKARTRAV
ncbi:hypothetical protein [Nonomuraea sp. SBT364]|uniref:hypothetical protein n=1 Tax=Nonomuraea sp. SBT364 TaxID=1580530 RepID=UPI00066C523F|nr:hypothetical protein [Nonomuraea sp. SBT364]